MARDQLQKFAVTSLVILIIVGFGLRYTGFLQPQPRMFSFDEIVYTYLGRQLIENPLNYDPEPAKKFIRSINPRRKMPAYMDEPIFKHPPLFPWLISISYIVSPKILTPQAPIAPSLFMGCLGIALIFFFAKMLYGYRVGLLAAFFLTFDPLHWLCSEKIWMEMTLAIFIFLALFFFFRGLKRAHFLLLSGLFVGLALLTKYTGIIAPVFIFLFALLYKEELLFKRNFWLIFIIALAVFSPWLVWNYHIYGASFLKKMLSIQGYAFRHLQKYQAAIFLMVITVVSLLILRILTPKFTPSMRKKISSLFKGIRYLLGISILTIFVLMLFHPSFCQSLKNMWIYNYLPSAGWVGHMFRAEPWCFYFGRLLELSPIYFFSYLAAIFFSFKNNQKDSLLILSAFLMMLFFVLLGYYESRYILPIVPILIILASRLQVWLWDRLKEQPQTLKIKVSRLLFLGMVGYFIIKTINVGIRLALPNEAIIF